MKNSRKLQLTPWLIFFVGMHSIFLGIFIYFFTDYFYQEFFSATVENIFFVRQSGVFLFLAGFFYLYPLLNIKQNYNLLLLVVFSKIIAVLFLISNAEFTLSPIMIYLAAFFDGIMAFLLIFTHADLGLKVNISPSAAVKRPQHILKIYLRSCSKTTSRKTTSRRATSKNKSNVGQI